MLEYLTNVAVQKNGFHLVHFVKESALSIDKWPHRHDVFITDDGYLISNYHVVKDATKVRLLTSAGLIDAKVVQVDAATDPANAGVRDAFCVNTFPPTQSHGNGPQPPAPAPATTLVPGK